MKVPKEKKERSLGEHLHLKPHRCDSPKCALVRKPYQPGAHGKNKRPKALSDFGRQIKEKQKFKLTYGIDEKNLKQIFDRARSSSTGISEKLLELLERRLDNVLFRLGIAASRSIARQIVTHGHIFVNGHRVRSPGFEMNVGDVVTIRPESKTKGQFRDMVERLKQYDLPSWLSLELEKGEGKVLALPQNVETSFETNLLVESFSK